MSHLQTTSFQQVEKYRQDLLIHDSIKGCVLQFKTTWGLFSPRGIDAGSRLLLENLSIKPDDQCLDLGCGYGPLGIYMAKQTPRGSVCMVDKDFVAVEYCQKNILLNRIDNAECFLSNGFNQLEQRRFDLIVSNLPAKVGNEMLSLYLADAWHYLHPGGRLLVVTISGMRKFIQRSCNTFFDNYKKIKQGKNYTVAMAVKSSC